MITSILRATQVLAIAHLMAILEIPDELYQQLHISARNEGLSIEAWLAQQTSGSHPMAKIADTVLYMLYIFDRELGHDIFINKYTEVFTGMTLAQMQADGENALANLLHPDDADQFADYLSAWDTANDQLVVKEYRLKHAHGDYRWMRSYEAVLERSHDGTPTQIIGTAIDITEQKLAEDALRQSESRLRSLVETHTVFMIRTDLDGNYTYFNQAFFDHHGWVFESAEEMMGTPALNSVLTEDHAKNFRVVEECLRHPGKPFQVTLRKPSLDGKTIHTLWDFVALQDQTGHVTEIQCIGIDISDAAHAQEALRKSEARYRAIVENFPNGLIALYDENLRYMVADGQGLDAIGLTSDDLVGKRLRDVFPPDIYKRDEPSLLAALRGERVEVVVQFGEEFFRVITTPVLDAQGNVISGMVMSQNVTDLKRAEERQRELKDELELAIRAAELGIWHLDPQTNTLIWNQHMHEIFGIPPESFVGHIETFNDAIHPDDRNYVNQRLQEIHSAGEVFDVKFRIVRPDGEIRHIDAAGIARHDEAGNIIQLTGINLDITEYERSKHDLAASEARYRNLFFGSLNAIAIYDEHARIILINDVGAQNLGTTPDEAIGKTLAEFLPNEYEATRKRIRQVLTSQEIDQAENFVELPQGGRWFWCTFQPVYMDHSEPSAVQIISHDITERKQAEQLEAERVRLTLQLEKEQAFAAQRARLFSIISHEFRTPMTIIQSSSEILSKYHDQLSHEKRQEKTANITAQIRHLDRMLDEIDMLSQANHGFLNYRPQPIQVEKMCRDVLNHLQDSLQPNRSLTLDVTSKDNIALVDEQLMHHALTNLVSNAIKYSPHGGAIHLAVEQTSDMWLFSVHDSGIGIPEKDKREIFQPFHRASNVGSIKGTGVGLAVVKEVAERHGGSVAFESQVDIGSTFTIFIPV